MEEGARALRPLTAHRSIRFDTVRVYFVHLNAEEALTRVVQNKEQCIHYPLRAINTCRFV